MLKLSFDDSLDKIPIIPGGTPASMGEPFPYGAAGLVMKAATVAQIRSDGWEVEGAENDILYWFEYKGERNTEYVWRSNLYPVPEG